MTITKEELQQRSNEMISWVKYLNKLPEDKWRVQIAKGKWTIAEIIAHLSEWDSFLIHSRLSIPNGNFPNTPDVDEFNSIAAKYGREESKEKVINDFVENRNKLIHLLNSFEENDLNKPFYKSYSILEYLGGFIEHDLHHKKQVVDVIGEWNHE